jgi:hypothetical protein
MKVRVMMMVMIAVSVVTVNETNMLVNCSLITQFKSKCLLLKISISFEIAFGNSILLCVCGGGTSTLQIYVPYIMCILILRNNFEKRNAC